MNPSDRLTYSFTNATRILVMKFHCLLRACALFLSLVISMQVAYGQDRPAAQEPGRPVAKVALPPAEPEPVINRVSRVIKDPAEAALAKAAEKRAARQKALENECVIKTVMSNSEIQNCNRAH
jgi:hypothetical protein